MPAAFEAVSVDLEETREPILTEVLPGLAHGLGGDVVVPGEQLSVRNREGGGDPDVSDAHAVQEGHALDGAARSSKLVQEAVPEQVRNRDH